MIAQDFKNLKWQIINVVDAIVNQREGAFGMTFNGYHFDAGDCSDQKAWCKSPKFESEWTLEDCTNILKGIENYLRN